MPMTGHLNLKSILKFRVTLWFLKRVTIPPSDYSKKIYSVAVSYLESKEQVHPQGDSLVVSMNSVHSSPFFIMSSMKFPWYDSYILLQHSFGIWMACNCNKIWLIRRKSNAEAFTPINRKRVSQCLLWLMVDI